MNDFNFSQAVAWREPVLRIKSLFFLIFCIAGCLQAQTSFKEPTSKKPSTKAGLTRLITLDPGHYHAALLQKSMFPQIDSTVDVYAPDGPDVKAHLEVINKFNTRSQDPTAWKEKLYTGPDYLDKMLKAEKPGGVVVIAGNNRKKTEYIKRSVDAGLNVLADKPMAIKTTDFEVLRNAFSEAAKKKVLLYDIMTSRYEITNMLQKEFMQMPELFGKLKQGTLEQPAVEMKRVHYFLKYVAGAPLIRPVWYFDIEQEGNGIVDVTTHMVDLIQSACFPETIFKYKQDVKMISAKRWATRINPTQFKAITNSDHYPSFLEKDIEDSILNVYANGEMNYTLKGVHAKIIMQWDVKATDGNSDTHNSIFHGTLANLVTRQGKEQQYNLTLFIEAISPEAKRKIQQSLPNTLLKIERKFPGITLKETNKGWEVIVPEKYLKLREMNYEFVTNKYLQYLQQGSMPEWEVSSMITKYYTTTQALEKALKN
ncbi:putative oxidoreductase C-terminal domain-containing protein [Flavitalea sp.]|nr:putative oxidoreductase C-terminal domain-containing protein [Flavitalea sp.]